MVLSFEVFPPKLDAPIDTIYKTLDGMKGLEPDFISVTYGASGKNNSSRTFQIASDIRIESVASLCGATISQKFTTMMDKYGDNPIAMRDAGIAYAIN